MTKTVEELETQLEKALASISKLEAKNEEVIGKLKNETARAEAAEIAADEADANAAAGNELKTLQRDYQKLEKTVTTLTAERDTLAADLRSTRVDSAISAAIASGNVRPEMVEAVEAVLHRKVQYEDGAASIDGKEIAAFAKTYFSKDGAHFVRAADNSGADAIGNSGAKAADYSSKPFALGEYQNLLATNPQAAAAWAEASGNAYLNKTV